MACVQLLLQQGQHPDGGNWDWAKTPLMLACEGGHVAVVRALLEAGADHRARRTFEQLVASSSPSYQSFHCTHFRLRACPLYRRTRFTWWLAPRIRPLLAWRPC